MTISAFSDELAQVRTKKKEFLSQIERTDRPWGEWLAMIQPCYKGSAATNPIRWRSCSDCYLLQNLYDLVTKLLWRSHRQPRIFEVLRR